MFVIASRSPLPSPVDESQTPLSPTWGQLRLLNRISDAYEIEVKRLSSSQLDETPIPDKVESSRAAHARRREQVRRAQRKHRERKEVYIKTLEQQVLQLLDQQSIQAEEKKVIQTENDMLRELLSHNGIAIPHEVPGFGPAATVSMLDLPGGQQKLQITMPELGPDFFAGLGPISTPLPLSGSSPESIEIDSPPSRGRAPQARPPPSFPTRLPSQSVEIRPVESRRSPAGKSLPPLPPPTPAHMSSHPTGLDAAQIAIDFVLALEHPCLGHTSPNGAGSSNGHCLTFQAPILTHRQGSISPQASWTVPAVEIDRLLNLSSQLNLQGELTPVQAWSRLRSYPGFDKLNYDQLDNLKRALLQEVHCYGFGAVMDEGAFELVLRQCFFGLS